MEKIASFTVNHDLFGEGIYLSRMDGDVATYDVRMFVPNGGVYCPVPVAHTIEHLFATYARSSAFGDRVIYVGPMGCRTGFYLLTRSLAPQDVLRLVCDSMAFIAGFSGQIPGATRTECGNWQEHDLAGAKALAARLLPIYQAWTTDQMTYPVA